VQRVAGADLAQRQRAPLLSSPPGVLQLSADAFVAVLRAHGLKFGDPAVDRVMIMCKIGDDGQVDFSRLRADVEHRAASSAFAASFASPTRPAPSSSSITASRPGTPRNGPASADPAASARTPSAPSVIGSGSLAGRSYEFRTALEATTGTSLPSSLPPELLALSQVRGRARVTFTLPTHSLPTPFVLSRLLAHPSTQIPLPLHT